MSVSSVEAGGHVEHSEGKGDQITLPEAYIDLDEIAASFDQNDQPELADNQLLPDDPEDISEAEPPTDVAEAKDSVAEDPEAQLRMGGRPVFASRRDQPSGPTDKPDRVTLAMGSGPTTHLQQVSDKALRSDLGYINQGDVPVAPDHDKGTIAAVDVAVDRLRQNEATGKPCKPVLCEVDASTGHKSQVALERLRTEHPDIYSREDCEVVLTGDEKRLKLLEGSGAFDEHIAAGKVRFQPTDDNDRFKIPEQTLLAFAPPPNELPAVRLFKKDGKVLGAREWTTIDPRDVTVEVDTSSGEPTPRAAWPDEWRYGVGASGGVDLNRAAKLDSVSRTDYTVAEDVTVTALGRKLDTAKAYMDEAPDGPFLRNYQEGVAELFEQLVAQAELVHADGFFARPAQRVPRPVLSRQSGLVVSHVTPVDLIKQGAEAARVRGGTDDNGVRIVIPPGKPDLFSSLLIDASPRYTPEQKERSDATAIQFQDGVTASGGALRVLRSVRQCLMQERRGEADDGLSAAMPDCDLPLDDESPLGFTTRIYKRYAANHPEAAVDYDLQLDLARAMYEQGKHRVASNLRDADDGGYYSAAIRFADQAIKAAPQLAAGAHHLRAQAFIGLAQSESEGGKSQELFNEARAAIDQALVISPRDHRLYHTQARIAVLQGDEVDWDAYGGALIKEQQYGPMPPVDKTLSDEAKRLQRAQRTALVWQAICEARGRLAERASGTIPVGTETTKYDPDREAWVTTVTMGEADRRDLERQALARLALNAALAVEVMAPDGYQDEVMTGLLKIFEHNRPRDDKGQPLPLSSLTPEHLQYYGEEALEAEQLAREALEALPLLTVDTQPIESGRRELGGMSFAEQIRPDTHRTALNKSSILPIQAFNTPVLILGLSGTGKTTTVSHIVKWLTFNGVTEIPWLIADCGPGPSYGPLAARFAEGFDGRKRPVFYWDFADPEAPTLNMMDPRPLPAPKHITNVLAWTGTLSNAEEPFGQLAEEAIWRLYSDAGFPVMDDKGEPSLNVLEHPLAPFVVKFGRDFIGQARRAGYGARMGPEVTAFVERRVGRLFRLMRILGADRPYDRYAIHNTPTIADMTSFGEDIPLIASALDVAMTRDLQGFYGHLQGADPGLRHVTFYEEGHKFFGRPDGPEQTAKAAMARARAERLATLRKFGEGTVIITANPHNLIPQVFDTSTGIVHRISNRATREEIGNALNLSEEMMAHLGQLRDQEAYVSHQGQPELVLMDEWVGPSSYERVSIPVSQMTRGGRRPVEGGAYSDTENAAAFRAVRSKRLAKTVVWMTALAAGHLNIEQMRRLPPPPQEVKDRWDITSPRQRQCELEAVLDMIAVKERAEAIQLPLQAVEFSARLKAVATNILNGGPAAGKQAGSRFVNPHLSWWGAVGDTMQPYAGPPRDPRHLARPLLSPPRGVTEQPGKGEGDYQRTDTQRRNLLLSPDRVWGKPVNQASALSALNGTALETALRAAYGDKAVGFAAQLRLAEIDMGLVEPGAPGVGPLTRLYMLPKRVEQPQPGIRIQPQPSPQPAAAPQTAKAGKPTKSADKQEQAGEPATPRDYLTYGEVAELKDAADRLQAARDELDRIEQKAQQQRAAQQASDQQDPQGN